MFFNKLKTLLFATAAAITLSSAVSVPVFAEDEVLWSDEGSEASVFHKIVKRGDSIVIIQRNKEKTSPICASTIGYQVTNKATGEQINIGIPSSDVSQNVAERTSDPKTGYSYVTIESEFSGDLSKAVLDQIKAYGTNVQMDNVMATSTDNGNSYSSRWNPATKTWEVNPAWLNDPTLAKIIAASGGDGAFGYEEGYAFAYQTFGWADKEGWLTNFRKVLMMDGQKLEDMTVEELEAWMRAHPEITTDGTSLPPDLDIDKDVIYRGSSNGQVEFYNDSRNYEENGSHKGFADSFDTDANGSGIIIPSSEKYITGIKARTYAGIVAIGLGGDGHTFSFGDFAFDFTEHRMKWVDDYQKATHFDVTGNPDAWETVKAHWEIGDSKSWYDREATGKAYRTANYVYIYDMDLYDFSQAETTNETFTDTVQTFEGTDPHVLYDINPEEDGAGDPIGPVNAGDIADGDFHSTANGNARPNYSVTIAPASAGKEITVQGGYDKETAKYIADFSPDNDAHIKWGDIDEDAVSDADKDLGSFTNILYPSAPGAAPPPWTYTDGWTGYPTPFRVQVVADGRVSDWIQDGKKESHKTYVPTKYYAEFTTDELIVGYDENTVVAKVTEDVHFTTDKWTDTFTAKGTLPSYLQGYVGSTEAAIDAYISNVPDNETYETSPAFGGNIGSQQNIRADMKNGEYPTLFSSGSYEHILTYADKTAVSVGSGLKHEYNQDNPIIVQTPVVAPVLVYDDPDTGDNPGDAGYTPINTTDPDTGASGIGEQSSRKTQLLYQTTDGSGLGRDDHLVQMRLDESYWFKFDAFQHLSTQGYADWITGVPFDNNWSDDDIKFDKYVKAKYMHFPFAVCIYEQGNDKPTYYPLVTDEDDENYWIKIYDQNDPSTSENIMWTRFYIPSWAIEGSYPDDAGIRYKVESINVIDHTEYDHSDDDSAMAPVYNDDGDLTDAEAEDHELYVATYDIGVQVSGWVYDFQIVGNNNRDLYDKELTDAFSGKWHDILYPFAWNYEEKRAGNKNRLGGDDRYSDTIANYVRYTRDPVIAHTGDTVSESVLTRDTSSPIGWSNKNSVILDNTKSKKYTDAGTAPKGTEFAFSVRTISNLWNEGDTIEITPTFWYLSDDGTSYTQNDGLHVYYNDSTGNKENLYIEYGSDRDHELVKTTSLSNEMFNGAYLAEDLESTVLQPVYDAGAAKFVNTNDSSEVETLANAFKMRQIPSYTLSDIDLTTDLRLFTGHVDQLKANLTNDRDDVASLDDMYIIKPEDHAAVESCINPSMQTWFGTYILPSELYVSTMTLDEINAYIEEHGGLTDDNDEVWLQNGYLIVNFNIKTHNGEDSGKDLVYDGNYAGSQNMWKAQNQDTTAEVGNTYADSSSGHYGHKLINVNYGDVLVIDMGQSIDDWFTANYFTTQ